MNIYIVRHGQVLHNVLRKYSTDDEDLTDIGVAQALELKDKLVGLKYDIIYSSPLLRAKHTANIINSDNKSIIYDDRLKERSPGNLNGQPLSCTNRKEYWNYNTTIQYGTSENMKTFFKRVFSFIDDLKKENYSSVLIVAHSGVSKAFAAYFEGVEDGQFLAHGLKNCGIRKYEI